MTERTPEIVERDLRVTPDGYELEVSCRESIPLELVRTLETEVRRNRHRPIRGVLAPTGVWVEGQRAYFSFPAFDPMARRLDQVLQGLAGARAPLGPRLAAHVLHRATRTVENIDPRPRNLRLDASRIWLGQSGRVVLLAVGLETVEQFVVPELGAAVEPARALCSLFHRLIVGNRAAGDPGLPRDASLQAALQMPPDLKTWRTQLDRLRTTLGPPVDGSVLQQLVKDYVEASAPRGPQLLVEPSMEPTSTAASRRGAWSDVLGESVEAPTLEPRDASPEKPPAPPTEGARTTQMAPSLTREPKPPTRLSPSPPPAAPPISEPLVSLRAPKPDRDPKPETGTSTVTLAVGGILVLLAGAAWWASLPADRGEPPVAGPGPSPGPVPLRRQQQPQPPPPSGPRLPTRRTGALEGLQDDPVPAPEEAEVKKLPLLSVMSKPSGAAVEVDEGYVGKTPLVIPHRFEAREYQIRLTKDGFSPFVTTVRPDPERGSISVVAELEPSAR